MQLEEALLHTELSLHSREQAGREAEARNSRLARDVLNSRLASSRAVKQFEKRTVDGTYVACVCGCDGWLVWHSL